MMGSFMLHLVVVYYDNILAIVGGIDEPITSAAVECHLLPVCWPDCHK
jgi:hypothetical protein